MLVSLILLVIVNVLVDTSAQIKVTKARERPDWTQQAVVTAFLRQQQLYVYGLPGCVYGRPVWGRLKKVVNQPAPSSEGVCVFCIDAALWCHGTGK